MRLRDPRHDVELLERSATGANQGWGLTLGRDVVDTLRRHDPISAVALERASVHWTQQVVDIRGERVLGGGDYDVYGIRQAYWTSWQAAALTLRVTARSVTGTRPCGLAELPPSDLILAADGVQAELEVGHAASSARRSRESGNEYILARPPARFSTNSTTFSRQPITGGSGRTRTSLIRR